MKMLTGLVRDLPALVAKILLLDGVVPIHAGSDQFVSTIAELSQLFKANLREITGGAHAALTNPDGYEAHALMVGMRAVGAIAWRPPNLSREVATAVSTQVEIALTRATAIEATARMEASREGEQAPRRAHRFPDARAADTPHLDPCGSHNVDAGRGPRRRIAQGTCHDRG